jgi:2-haloacid dehalogenase
MSLRDYDVLTFDCYGTLIDWETGLFTAMAPLLARVESAPFREEALAVFARHEVAQQAETPDMVYSDLLAAVHRRLAAEWKVAQDPAEAAAFGRSVAEWPAFPDTPGALQYLKQHYKLVILSNVDRNSFVMSNARLGVEFDAIHTAQDIGSYKPDARNFEYLLARLQEQGIGKERVLHVAQSLFHDHVPANGIGLHSAWIDRRHDTPGWGATAPVPDNVRYDYRFVSLGALVEAHRTGAA